MNSMRVRGEWERGGWLGKKIDIIQGIHDKYMKIVLHKFSLIIFQFRKFTEKFFYLALFCSEGGWFVSSLWRGLHFTKHFAKNLNLFNYFVFHKITDGILFPIYKKNNDGGDRLAFLNTKKPCQYKYTNMVFNIL